MQSRWSESEANKFVELHAEDCAEDLALRTYTSRLLGAEESLVLHGGGNTSVKTSVTNRLGETIPAIFVKASGWDMLHISPDGYSGLELEYLLKLRNLPELADDAMVDELRTHLLDWRSATPSIETLVHAFIPQKFIDHTHADAILALTNQLNAKPRIEEALGSDVALLDYVTPGFKLAKAAAAAYERHPGRRGMVWIKHGLITWGGTARESYEAMVELVTRAEQYLDRGARHAVGVRIATPIERAQARWRTVAPVLRGQLAEPSGNPDQPFRRAILQPLITRKALDFLDSDRGKELALTPPVTSDHLIRTKPLPLWIDTPDYEDAEKLRLQLSKAVGEYRAAYEAYVARHSARLSEGVSAFDSLPRVILLPGMGAVGAGRDVRSARIARDITAHTLDVKARIARMAAYEGLLESEIFEMEYRPLQHAKVDRGAELPLGRHVALVTGAAGAVGSAISEALLMQGCHVAITDRAGESLDRFAAELEESYDGWATSVPLDVTDPGSVADGFAKVTETWGGVDLVIVNAGAAMVSSLMEMSLEAFRRLERINVEGSLLVMGEAARRFKAQGTGGDIVLV
ncbi:MAG: SDR family NAD(P)-dependent oxidoreductase, partial [Terriglobia bacterium]